VRVSSAAPETTCPLCQQRAQRVHSCYLRRVADLPWGGWSVRLRLHVRRFFCDNDACSRAIFTDRLTTVVAPYGPKTHRLLALLNVIGFALGGEVGRRLSQQIGIPISSDTLLEQTKRRRSPALRPRVSWWWMSGRFGGGSALGRSWWICSRIEKRRPLLPG